MLRNFSLGNKHYLSYENYPWVELPLYVFGGFYIIAKEAISPLLAAAQTTPYFPFEDVYLSGFCASKANVHVFFSEK
jgi:hypothetical protein